jgi:aspartate-semialdehyde dehydrogenase
MHVAILGATGAVGRTMLDVLAERSFPVDRLTLLASPRSAGTTIRWRGRDHEVLAPAPGSFRDVDVALFSAGAARSLEWAPRAVDEGAVVIDNSSAWRMDAAVPLVVPEVNAGAVAERAKGIIANPNCSTIQVVVPLRPLHDAAGLTRLVLTTFQSTSGAGEKGVAALRRERDGEPGESPFSREIYRNVIPQIGEFEESGWSEEERKMIAEPRKILSLPELRVAPTCIRVPVEVGHSVQMSVETERPLGISGAREALRDAPGIVLRNEVGGFDTPREIAGRDEVFVGRLRADPDFPNVIHLWVVADNLRKGAATNAVQIAELLANG